MSAVVPKQGDANSTQQTFRDFKSVFRKKSTTSFWRGKKKKVYFWGHTGRVGNPEAISVLSATHTHRGSAAVLGGSSTFPGGVTGGSLSKCPHLPAHGSPDAAETLMHRQQLF